ncbi:DUF1385 domain-containing protein [Thermoflavimicrobium daqui]|uniref:DUF1385 domain-containing protein n=1 Tax=Thermoflavimicrobium daqui TaxID=2137476 RepID=A0A364K9Z1_9BACL|nr:DUF1385 domain-containing protein [Thermoflavimicrobium daqui]RAL27098.1 DUF1385 domain-containing protein [Thermoflavimicrobium daqui]
MFGGRYTQVTAIRRKNGEIETHELYKKENPTLSIFKKIPLIRGIVSLIESSASGAKHLQHATEVYDLDLEEDNDRAQDTSSTNKTSSSWSFGVVLSVAVIGVLSFIIGKVIFTALPAFLSSILFDRFTKNPLIQSVIEGGIKTLLLLGYLWAISQTPLIKRLFQYHGAEHKVISTYELGQELTIKNVQKQSTLHYRCGSSFIILTVIVGVIVYSFFQYDTIWDRIWTRLLLLPIVIGLSYEVLRFTNAVRDIPVLRYLGYPGLWLQKLTTKEPTDDQVEVAIAAFNRMRELDAEVASNKYSKHSAPTHLSSSTS